MFVSGDSLSIPFNAINRDIEIVAKKCRSQDANDEFSRLGGYEVCGFRAGLRGGLRGGLNSFLCFFMGVAKFLQGVAKNLMGVVKNLIGVAGVAPRVA